MKFSSRALGACESETLRLSQQATQLRAQGRDIIRLMEGEPDLPVPEPVIKATQEALRAGRTRYSSSTGLPELKESLARKLLRDNNIPASPDDILVANGAKQIIYEVLQALCEPGDEVLIPAPYWVTFPEAVRLAGARPILVPTTDSHQLDLDALSRAVTAATRVIIINSPNNPTGAVYDEPTLRALVTFAAKHDLTILSDEAYESLAYDGKRHISVASLGDEAMARTVTVQTFSKAFGMTGFRVGYLAAPSELVGAVARMHSHITGNACTFAQHGAIAALALGEEHRRRWRTEHQLRRDVAFTLGSKLFDCKKPEGGLFLFADVRRHLGKTFATSSQLADHILKTVGVGVVPGSAFGREGFLRLSFSSPELLLRSAFARLEKAL